MKLQIRSIIKFQDNESGDNFTDSNDIGFDWSFTADSKETVEVTDEGIEKDFKISNFNKHSFELKHGNDFSVNIQQQLLSGADLEVTSLHVFCYQSTSQAPFRLPIKFEVSFENQQFSLGKCSEFSCGNLAELSDDVVISNIVIPEGCKANLVILVGTKEAEV